MKAGSRNVFGQPLKPCSESLETGWFRNGCCDTAAGDRGRHVVCAQVTAEFLEFSRDRGNDLSTPRPEFRFPGLKPGDRWCLCAARWKEAEAAGVAPPVMLQSTEVSALEVVDLEQLSRHALDVN